MRPGMIAILLWAGKRRAACGALAGPMGVAPVMIDAIGVFVPGPEASGVLVPGPEQIGVAPR